MWGLCVTFRSGTALALLALGLIPAGLPAQNASPTVTVDSRMSAPAWATAQRELIQLNAEAVRVHRARRFDARGYSLAPPQWGVGAGPDDVTEAIRNWPLAHAAGGPDSIIETWSEVWEAHLTQYGEARVPQVEMAREGILHKEFTTAYDWEHIGEGLGPFYYHGLSRPDDPRHVARARRYAGFYMNEDPEAQNYDPERKIIRSLFNGSRGADLTPATVDDWDGPLPDGVSPTAARRTRFANPANQNIRGDHPLNLSATMLHLNAYMLTGDPKYRRWLLEYVDAWAARAAANGGNLPSNVGLDGKIGSEWGGKWYGGVFGWSSPDQGVRNYSFRGPPEAFGGALLLTGDQKYVRTMRRQIDNLYKAARTENGRVLIPRYYGDQGWYGHAALDDGPTGALGNIPNIVVLLYLWSFAPGDRQRMVEMPPLMQSHHPDSGWLQFIQGKNSSYPATALQAELETVRRALAAPAAEGGAATRGAGGGATGVRAAGEGRGATAGGRAAGAGGRGAGGAGRAGRGAGRGGGGTPNPATEALINLTMGGADPGGSTHGPAPLFVQVRHFDPESRRAGLPEDVAALVESFDADEVRLTLLNVGTERARTVTVQMGAYGEHRATTVTSGGRKTTVNASWFNVRLQPGAGTTLTIGVRRYANRPTLAFPWTRPAGR